VDTVEKRIAPEVRNFMNQLKECPYELELPNVKSTEWNLAKAKVLGDTHFIPWRDGKSLLVGSLTTVNGEDVWKRLNPVSLSPSLVMAAKISLGLQPELPASREAPASPAPRTPEKKTQAPAPVERPRAGVSVTLVSVSFF
jgi:hypothetical protein